MGVPPAGMIRVVHDSNDRLLSTLRKSLRLPSRPKAVSFRLQPVSLRSNADVTTLSDLLMGDYANTLDGAQRSCAEDAVLSTQAIEMA